jgi:hypothetical protein
VTEKDIEYQSIQSKFIGNQVETKNSYFRHSKNGMLMYKNRLYISEVEEIKLLIPNELHKKPYSRHPSYPKIITILRKEIYCPNMKGEIV